MKRVFLLFFVTNYILANSQVSAQINSCNFLAGTWKMEGKENYEHWDLLLDGTLLGFAYKMNDGKPQVLEYLSIEQKGKQPIYTARVLNQNSAKPIGFQLVYSDSALVFENLKHDFPKRISYKKLSENRVEVHISDTKETGYKFVMEKEVDAKTDSSISANPNFDAALAKKLGADKYGMKAFVLVILKTGSSENMSKEAINEAFRGHMQNIEALVEDEKLIVAGPLGKNAKNYRGIFIFNVSKVENAEALVQSDPAVKSGLLKADCYQWYGSAALSEYIKASDKIWEIKP